MLVQEEGRLKKMKEHSVHFIVHDGVGSSKAKPGKKFKKKDKSLRKVNEGQVHKEQRCFSARKLVT